MSAIISMLMEDHQNISRLLERFERQLDCVLAGEDADIEHMHDIALYMVHYPDPTHHPLEDVLMEKLARRDRGAAGLIATLEREHDELVDRGCSLVELLRDVLDGNAVAREPFESTCRDYLALFARHMASQRDRANPTSTSDGGGRR